MKKLQYHYPPFVIGLSFFPFIAAAATIQTLGTLLRGILGLLNLLIYLLFALAFVVFIWGIIKFLASAGNEAERTKAKGIMTWGIIGLAIMATAWGLVQLLINTFGIYADNPTIPQIPAPS